MSLRQSITLVVLLSIVVALCFIAGEAEADGKDRMREKLLSLISKDMAEEDQLEKSFKEADLVFTESMDILRSNLEELQTIQSDIDDASNVNQYVKIHPTEQDLNVIAKNLRLLKKEKKKQMSKKLSETINYLKQIKEFKQKKEKLFKVWQKEKTVRQRRITAAESILNKIEKKKEQISEQEAELANYGGMDEETLKKVFAAELAKCQSETASEITSHNDCVEERYRNRVMENKELSATDDTACSGPELVCKYSKSQWLCQ